MAVALSLHVAYVPYKVTDGQGRSIEFIGHHNRHSYSMVLHTEKQSKEIMKEHSELARRKGMIFSYKAQHEGTPTAPSLCAISNDNT